MNLEQLMELGGFVPAELVEKEVEWKGAKGGPAKFTIFLKSPSAATYDRTARALVAAGDTSQETMAQRPLLISTMVFFDKEGKTGISYVEACQLHDGLCRVLYTAASEVLEAEAEAAKNSQPPTSSGANLSSTESVAKP